MANAQKTTAQPQRQGKKRKRRRHSRLFGMLLAAFLVLLVASAAVFVVRLFVYAPSEQTLGETMQTGLFIPGVSVNGQDISGLTVEQARALLMPQVEEDANKINIRIVHGNSVWVLGSADMGAASNLDAVLYEAIRLGHSGTYVENKQVQEETLENGRDYTAGFVPDEKALAEKLAQVGLAMDTPPIEPSVSPITTSAEPAFNYYEGVDGYMLDEAALAQDITERLAQRDFNAVLEPTLELTPPSHTMEWVKENTVLRATFQTSFGGSRSAREENRVGNIQKATTILNGAIVPDGAQFDFNEYIGPRTEDGGWPLAPGIVSGSFYEMQAGGGICQVSTTLYITLLSANADWKQDFAPEEGADLSAEAPIIVNERHHHSWPSAYSDRGLDATVTTGGKNLRFINNTGGPLYIFAYCDQENYLMTIYLYGVPLPDGITYKLRGDTVETIEPGAPAIVENPEWPIGFSHETKTARNGYKAEVYRERYVDGVLDEGSTEKLYTDSYRSVQGETTIGTGPSSLPTPDVGD